MTDYKGISSRRYLQRMCTDIFQNKLEHVPDVLGSRSQGIHREKTYHRQQALLCLVYLHSVETQSKKQEMCPEMYPKEVPMQREKELETENRITLKLEGETGA